MEDMLTSAMTVAPVESQCARTEVLGFPVDSVTMDGALTAIETFIEQATPRIVVALNAPKMRRMESDARLREICCRADLVLPEKIVFWASKLGRIPLRAYIGNDRLTMRFLPLAAQKRYRVYFLGTRPEVLNTLCTLALQRYPGIQIAGCHHGYFSEPESKAVAQLIRTSKPDVLLVGMGTPRQEYWMADYAPELQVPVVIGVGGTLDVLAGFKRNCPDWVRAAGLEWLYRMVEDPSGKSKRYLQTAPWFAKTLVTHGILKSLGNAASNERRN